MRATVIADASFCPKTKAAGWAAWITPDVGVRIQRAGKFLERPDDNNMAEAWAAMNGVAHAYRIGARVILLQSDCLAVGRMVSKGAYGYPAVRMTHFPDADIRFRHVRGHTTLGDRRSYVNRWCDAEAKRHMREVRDAL